MFWGNYYLNTIEETTYLINVKTSFNNHNIILSFWKFQNYTSISFDYFLIIKVFNKSEDTLENDKAAVTYPQVSSHCCRCHGLKPTASFSSAAVESGSLFCQSSPCVVVSESAFRFLRSRKLHKSLGSQQWLRTSLKVIQFISGLWMNDTHARIFKISIDNVVLYVNVKYI